MLDDICPDLDVARAKIHATRTAPDVHEAPCERLAALVARLDRMAVQVKRVEDVVAGEVDV